MVSDGLKKLWTALVFTGLMSVSCSPYGKDVREALRHAGDNRGELEQVMEHYSHDKSDSLKRKAALYLIGNMTWHRSYPAEAYSRYCREMDSVSVSDIRAKCRRFKMKNPNLGLILIDYLQLIEDRSSNDRNQQISSISRGLKSLARELDVPIIALSQLSRKVEDRTDKRPMLSDLRESGAIEQDADVVMFIFREEYYDKENPELKNKAQIIIAKQRNGPTGSFELIFQGSTTKFKNKVNPNLS